jgi:hypothetical protein
MTEYQNKTKTLVRIPLFSATENDFFRKRFMKKGVLLG